MTLLFGSGAEAPPPLRLQRHVVLETDDLDRAREHLGGVFAPHRLDRADRAGGLVFRHAHAPFGELSFNMLQYGADVTVRAPELQDFYLVQVTLGGSCQIREAGRRAGDGVRLAPGTICVTNPARAYSKRWSAEGRQLILRVGRRAVEQSVAETFGEARAPIFDAAPVMLGAETRSLMRLIEAVCRDVEDDAGAFTAPAVRRRLEGSLVALLLGALPHDLRPALARGAGDAAPALVHRAQAFIRDRAGTPISLAEIAQAAGASPRALQAGFRRFCGTTPTGYLRGVRLDLARRALAAGQGAGVTDIALASGFGHLGKFAHAYRLRFGETPSTTWRRRR
jgi:AraC-like DNA-binding protein